MSQLCVRNTKDITIGNRVVRNETLHQVAQGETVLSTDSTNDEDIIAALQQAFVEEVGSMGYSDSDFTLFYPLLSRKLL